MEPDEGRCCFDEWASYSAKRARKSGTGAPVTRYLVAALERAGLRGRSVLDVGCGAGDLALATLDRGATRATGIDLGPGAVAEARRLAEERGLADRATFDRGDGSTAPLAPHDVVVLNRVVCCYPNVEGLLTNTLGAAGDVYAVTAPLDHGVSGLLNRVVTRVSNVWFAIRRTKYAGFRVFMHDLAAIDERIRSAGFKMLVAERRRFVWRLTVYAR